MLAFAALQATIKSASNILRLAMGSKKNKLKIQQTLDW